MPQGAPVYTMPRDQRVGTSVLLAVGNDSESGIARLSIWRHRNGASTGSAISRGPANYLWTVAARAIIAAVNDAPGAGALPTDKDALVRLTLGISDLRTAFPEIAQLDLNPVLAYPKGRVILDARILLQT